MGADAPGDLLHTGDGRFSVLISRAGQPPVGAGDLLGGTTEEQARPWRDLSPTLAATASMATRVIRHVELSLLPNRVGGDQQRWVELAGDRLILSASPLLLAGKQQVARLVWKRVDPD